MAVVNFSNACTGAAQQKTLKHWHNTGADDAVLCPILISKAPEEKSKAWAQLPQ